MLMYVHTIVKHALAYVNEQNPKIAVIKKSCIRKLNHNVV